MICRLSAPIATLALGAVLVCPRPHDAGARRPQPPSDRSPVDIAFTPDERFLLTANQSSNSVSLVEVASGAIAAERPCGERPAGLAVAPDGRRVAVASSYGGNLTVFDRTGANLTPVGLVALGFEPRGVVISPDSQFAYVALTSGSAVAVVDLAEVREVARIEVGRWPRYMALSPDGTRLAIGVSGDKGVAVVDTAVRTLLYREDFNGLNLGQMQTSADGQYVYFPYMTYTGRPIQEFNVTNGWVLASRIARVKLTGPARREAISLDPKGMAVADPHGLAISPDGKWLYCAASGTHELLVYKLPGLPLQDYGGPGDHIDPKLLADDSRFFRIPLGGRPTAIRVAKDGTVFVANALANAVQVVDAAARKVVRTISLGGPDEPDLARRGEAIFYDGTRSFDQWYSCHSCHYDGHTNAVTMDTRNDGRFGNYKVVLSLRNVARTGPWTWHGWSNDLAAITKKSMLDSMLGKAPTADDVNALVTYLGTLRSPANPHRATAGEAAKRGEAVFRSAKAGCATCHSGDYFTDGKIHSVGTGEKGDVYKGYNPPSLVGVFDRAAYLHDGRAKSLRELLTKAHNPEDVVGKGALTPAELADLVAYLLTL